MTPTEMRESSDPFTIAVREYILSTLSPLIPTGESTGKFMYSLLRRALKSATREDLEQVVLHCIAFADGLRERGFISDELARQAEQYISRDLPIVTDSLAGEAPTDRAEVPGPGAPDRTDEERQEHTGEALDTEVLRGDETADEGLRTPESVGGGHEATMEGNQEGRWYGNTEALPENGAG